MADEELEPKIIDYNDQDEWKKTGVLNAERVFANRFYLTAHEGLIRITFADEMEKSDPGEFLVTITMSPHHFMNLKALIDSFIKANTPATATQTEVKPEREKLN